IIFPRSTKEKSFMPPCFSEVVSLSPHLFSALEAIGLNLFNFLETGKKGLALIGHRSTETATATVEMKAGENWFNLNLKLTLGIFMKMQPMEYKLPQSNWFKNRDHLKLPTRTKETTEETKEVDNLAESVAKEEIDTDSLRGKVIMQHQL
ncbi:WD repeat-containing protein 93, partial [Corchorus capsularis]